MTLNFEQQMRTIARRVVDRYDALFDAVDAHVGRSIMFGSPVTAAPGQPVKSGALLMSWKRNNAGRYQVSWSSDSKYAHIIEDNRRGATLRSKVGGFHSVKLTRVGFQRIVEYELKAVTGARFDRNVQRWRNARGQFMKRPF